MLVCPWREGERDKREIRRGRERERERERERREKHVRENNTQTKQTQQTRACSSNKQPHKH
jgi:hypothetical protein